jgi:hypothetical protein
VNAAIAALNRCADMRIKPTAKLRLVSLLALTALACCFLPFSAKAVDPSGPAQNEGESQFINALMGRVVDEDGKPIPSAWVSTESTEAVGSRDANRYREPRRVSSDGQFTFMHLPPGDVTLYAIAPGCRTARLTAPTDAIDFTVTMARLTDVGARYNIAVVDENEEPVAGARVRLLMKVFETGATQSNISSETRTDAQGKATISYKPERETVRQAMRMIVCDRDGYDLAMGFVYASSDSDLRFVLRKSGDPWRGRVIDEAGRPIDGATVEVKTTGTPIGPLLSLLDAQFKTGPDGRFELSRFSSKDRISADISAPLHCPVTACFDESTGYTYVGGWPTEKSQKKRNTNGVFRLARGADVVGRVVHKETGKPFAYSQSRIKVEGHLATRDGKGIRSRAPIGKYSPIAEDGSFRIQGLVPIRDAFRLDSLPAEDRARIDDGGVTWILRFSSTHPEGKRYIWGSPPAFDIQVGETKEVLVEVEEGTLVTGTVLDAKTGKPPLDWVRFEVTNPRTSFSAWGSPRQHDGSTNWEIYLPPGEFQLKYCGPGTGGGDVGRTIAVEPGKTLDCGVHLVNVGLQ